MRPGWTWRAAQALVMLLAFGGGAAFAQEDPKKESPEEEEELTPEQAMAMLKDIHGLMRSAEELLNNASRGKALETEKKILEELEKEFKDDPGAMQKAILEKIRKIMQRSEKRQKDTIEKLNEIIKRART